MKKKKYVKHKVEKLENVSALDSKELTTKRLVDISRKAESALKKEKRRSTRIFTECQ